MVSPYLYPGIFFGSIFGERGPNQMKEINRSSL
jgi:hypothetical protein